MLVNGGGVLVDLDDELLGSKKLEITRSGCEDALVLEDDSRKLA